MFLGNPLDADFEAKMTQENADFVVSLKEILEGDEDYSFKVSVLGENGIISNPQYYVDETQKNADEARRIADGGEFDYDAIKAIEKAAEEAKEMRDEAKEERNKANALEAQECADEAQKRVNEAKEIADKIADDEKEDAQERIEKAQEYADEAQDFADAAQELEEMIRDMFEEEDLPEEEYEDFKQGVLDELFGEGAEEMGEMMDEVAQDMNKVPVEIKEGIKLKQRYGRKYVNWETGEVRYYDPSKDSIGNEWIEVTPFFTGIYDDGKEIVVDRTLEGAKQLLNYFGIKTKDGTDTSFKMVNPTDEAVNLLREMRMFIVSGDEVSY